MPNGEPSVGLLFLPERILPDIERVCPSAWSLWKVAMMSMRFEADPEFRRLDADVSMRFLPLQFVPRIRRNMLKVAISEWEPGIAPSQWEDRVSRRRGDFGNPLLIMILMPIIAELIKMLVDWLIEKYTHEELMSQWMHECRGA